MRSRLSRSEGIPPLMTLTRTISGRSLIPTALAVGMLLVFSGSLGAAPSTDRAEARRLLRGAVENYRAGDMERAVVLLDSLDTVDADNPDAVLLRAKVLLNSADTLSAQSLLEQSIEKSPRSARLKLLLARVYLDQQRLEEAEGLVDKVLRIRPHESEALYLKGLARAARGDTLQALDLYERALEGAIEKGRKR